MYYKEKYEAALEMARMYHNNAKDAGDYSAVARYENIFPELSESEDEKLRRGLITFLNLSEVSNKITFEAKTKWIELLEKQKTTNEEGDFARGYDCGYECCLHSHGAEWFEKQKEQKDYRKLYEDIAKSEWFKKAYVGKSLGEDEQKEQKPVDQSVDVIKMSALLAADRLASAEMTGRLKERKEILENPEKYGLCKPVEKQDYSGLNDLKRAILRGFLAAGVENVPVRIIKETAQDCLVQTGLIKWELPEDFEEAVFKCVNFISPFSSEDELRKVSHRFAEQLMSLAKKEFGNCAEWSEEDEERAKEIKSYLTAGILPSIDRRVACVEWLKTRPKALRPSWKPGEDEERLIKTSISFLKDFADKGYENAVECIDWLKSKLNGNTCK